MKLAQCIFSVLLLYSAKAIACSCNGFPLDINVAVMESYKDADSVVLAKAESVNEASVEEVLKHGGLNYERFETTRFSEIRSWKGDHGKQFYTKIRTTCCLCGRQFIEGETYLLYLYKDGNSGYYVTSMCTRTKFKSNPETDADIKVLDQIVPE